MTTDRQLGSGVHGKEGDKWRNGVSNVCGDGERATANQKETCGKLNMVGAQVYKTT